MGDSTTHVLQTQLPLTRIKKIFRLDSNCTNISAEALQLLTLATERFIELLAKLAYGQAVFDKRKTLQLRDLEFCIRNYEPFNFLDGTLDGWPDVSRGKHGLGSESNVTITKKSERFISFHGDGEQENSNVHRNEVFGFDESLEGIEPFDGPGC